MYYVSWIWLTYFRELDNIGVELHHDGGGEGADKVGDEDGDDDQGHVHLPPVTTRISY